MPSIDKLIFFLLSLLLRILNNLAYYLLVSLLIVYLKSLLEYTIIVVVRSATMIEHQTAITIDVDINGFDWKIGNGLSASNAHC